METMAEERKIKTEAQTVLKYDKTMEKVMKSIQSGLKRKQIINWKSKSRPGNNGKENKALDINSLAKASIKKHYKDVVATTGLLKEKTIRY